MASSSATSAARWLRERHQHVESLLVLKDDVPDPREIHVAYPGKAGESCPVPRVRHGMGFRGSVPRVREERSPVCEQAAHPAGHKNRVHSFKQSDTEKAEPGELSSRATLAE